MQENLQEQMNPDENDLQQNYQNNYAVPQNYPQSNDPLIAYQQPNNQTVQQMIQFPMTNSDNTNIAPTNNVQAPQKQVNYTSYEIISFISWIIFMSAKWDYFMKTNFLGYQDNEQTNERYRPILPNSSFIQLISLIVTILGFLVYVKNIIYTRNNNFYYGLFGTFSKYHFVPLILYAGINIIMDIYISLYKGILTPTLVTKIKNDTKFDLVALCAFYMLFSLLTLLSIIYIYYTTEMKCEWYIVMVIKKGIYSLLIVESLYFFFDSIFYLRFVNIAASTSKIKELYTTGAIMFAILQGGIVIGLALYFKNITMPIFNFLMFYGMVMNFYSKRSIAYSSSSKEDEYKSDGAIVIEIIMVVLHVALIVFMISKYKEQLIE